MCFRTLLSYEIRYREVDKATYENKNMTKYEGRDGCGRGDWTVMDHTPSGPVAVSQGGTDALTWPEESESLAVKPYTHYAMFISTLLLKEYAGSKGIEGAESDIVYFKTPEDIPEPPAAVVVQELNYSTVNITWEPPQVPNGVIDHYEIILEFNDIEEAKILSLPYCNVSRGMRCSEQGAVDSSFCSFTFQTLGCMRSRLTSFRRRDTRPTTWRRSTRPIQKLTSSRKRQSRATTRCSPFRQELAAVTLVSLSTRLRKKSTRIGSWRRTP